MPAARMRCFIPFCYNHEVHVDQCALYMQVRQLQSLVY